MPGRTLTRIIMSFLVYMSPPSFLLYHACSLFFVSPPLFGPHSSDPKSDLVFEELSHFLALGSSVHMLVRLHIWIPCELTYPSSLVYVPVSL